MERSLRCSSSKLVAEVYTIEIIEPLAKRAEEDLRRLGYLNVKVLAGDGYKGWAEHAPGRWRSTKGSPLAKLIALSSPAAASLRVANYAHADQYVENLPHGSLLDNIARALATHDAATVIQPRSSNM